MAEYLASILPNLALFDPATIRWSYALEMTKISFFLFLNFTLVLFLTHINYFILKNVFYIIEFMILRNVSLTLPQQPALQRSSSFSNWDIFDFFYDTSVFYNVLFYNGHCDTAKDARVDALDPDAVFQ